jgi:hypothetical protein
VVRGVRSEGRRSARDGLRVVFSGSEESREDIGGRWRVLDLNKGSEEARVRAWVEDARDGDLEVCIVSSADHCACKTAVRRACVVEWLSRSYTG